MPVVVLFRMGRLTQGQRHAVVIHVVGKLTPIENGTLLQNGLGLAVAKAGSTLKFLFQVDVAFNASRTVYPEVHNRK